MTRLQLQLFGGQTFQPAVLRLAVDERHPVRLRLVRGERVTGRHAAIPRHDPDSGDRLLVVGTPRHRLITETAAVRAGRAFADGPLSRLAAVDENDETPAGVIFEHAILHRLVLVRRTEDFADVDLLDLRVATDPGPELKLIAVKHQLDLTGAEDAARHVGAVEREPECGKVCSLIDFKKVFHLIGQQFHATRDRRG